MTAYSRHKGMGGGGCTVHSTVYSEEIVMTLYKRNKWWQIPWVYILRLVLKKTEKTIFFRVKKIYPRRVGLLGNLLTFIAYIIYLPVPFSIWSQKLQYKKFLP